MSSKEELLRKEIVEKISHFKKESKRHKRIYRSLRYVAFGLTGGSTVLAGGALYFKAYQEWLNLAVVFATAMAAITSSIEGLRKPSELWVHERGVYYALIDLEREINYEASEPGGLKGVDDYFKRLQMILTSSKEEWARKVQVSDKGKS
jgi:hypothetical protein